MVVTLNPLADKLGKQAQEQNKTKENISPDDPVAALTVPWKEGITLSASIAVYSRRMTGVYIVGNLTYGVIEGNPQGDTFPVTMPITFEGTVGWPIGPICVLDSAQYGQLNDCILGDRDLDQYERTLLYSGS